MTRLQVRATTVFLLLRTNEWTNTFADDSANLETANTQQHPILWQNRILVTKCNTDRLNFNRNRCPPYSVETIFGNNLLTSQAMILSINKWCTYPIEMRNRALMNIHCINHSNEVYKFKTCKHFTNKNRTSRKRYNNTRQKLKIGEKYCTYVHDYNYIVFTWTSLVCSSWVQLSIWWSLTTQTSTKNVQ